MQQSDTIDSRSFWGTLGGAVTDFVGAYGQAYIDDKYGESSSERSEGPTEFANPHTVTQPVYQSQTPTGEPLNFGFLNSTAAKLGVPVAVLVVGMALAGYYIFVR